MDNNTPTLDHQTCIEAGPTPRQVITPPFQKPKRRRKEWVYKSQYDRLQEKYDIVKPLAISGWLLAVFSIALNMIFWFHR